MADTLIQLVDAVDGRCSCNLDREFTGSATLVDPLDEHGWPGWRFALTELLHRLLTGPTHVVIVDQPAETARSLQLLVGHGAARIEVVGERVEWWRVEPEPTAWELAHTVVDLAQAGLGFVDSSPVRLSFVGAESPCVRCLPFVLGSTDEHCVLCDSPVVEVVFGFPSAELFEAAERGEVVLGGCMPDDGPRRCCPCGRTSVP